MRLNSVTKRFCHARIRLAKVLNSSFTGFPRQSRQALLLSCKSPSELSLKEASFVKRAHRFIFKKFTMNAVLPENYKVLSIQSHVVSGYVGNKCATFVLQQLGFETDALNSVQFSNHKGYKHCKGHVLSSDQIGELYEGLQLNNIDNKYTHVLSGYVASADCLSKVYEILVNLKQKNEHLMYVCDPVMGDAGQFYVSEDCLPVYQNKLAPLADVITPNQFEAELLTGITIKTEEDALAAIDVLHDKGIPVVIISSSELGDENTLVALASIKSNGTKERLKMKIPIIPATFVGTGDMFAALILAWLTKSGYNLKFAFERAASTLHDILKMTYKEATSMKGDLNFEKLELKLLKSVSSIHKPQSVLESDELS